LRAAHDVRLEGSRHIVDDLKYRILTVAILGSVVTGLINERIFHLDFHMGEYYRGLQPVYLSVAIAIQRWATR
jgi:hypothetical protein